MMITMLSLAISKKMATPFISYYGVCRQCGAPLGFKEIFHLTDWDYISPDEVKKVLTNFKGYGKIIKR
jgi:hypothetical protein